MTSPTVELLQTMIRNKCVNDGTAASGQEARNVDTLEAALAGPGLDIERFEAAPGRSSLVARIQGSDPAAPSLALMGHTDVVPVNEEAWRRDPFAGDLVDGEVWGRGAVDMLNLTASMAVAVRELADSGFRPTGDLVFVAVADEESASTYGMRWMADNHRDAISADYVLTENGGLHSGDRAAPLVDINVAEKGVAWRRLRVRGTPGHGSMPFRSDNALVKAAAAVTRITDYRPPPRFHELWPQRVASLGLSEEQQQILLDADRIDDLLAAMPNAGTAAYFHACTHTTFSCNVTSGVTRPTSFPPRSTSTSTSARCRARPTTTCRPLRRCAGRPGRRRRDHLDDQRPATISPTDTPLWDALHRSVNAAFPGASLLPSLTVGFTDARIYRELGAVAYGAGLLSPTSTPASSPGASTATTSASTSNRFGSPPTSGLTSRARCSADLRVLRSHPAVDGDDDAVDVGRRGQHERQRHLRDLLGVAVAAKRHAAARELRLRLVGDAGRHPGVDRAGTDAVERDAGLCQARRRVP